METFLDVLKVIGVCALGFIGLIAFMMLGYFQATWGMTPEEKEAFDKYIQENGILGGDDDDHWPF